LFQPRAKSVLDSTLPGKSLRGANALAAGSRHNGNGIHPQCRRMASSAQILRRRAQGEIVNLSYARGLPLSFALLLMPLFAFSAFAAEAIRAMTSDSIEFKPDPNVPGIATALIAGNPKLRPTYTVRAKFSANVRVPAPLHPDQRVVTVISGTYYFGSGEKFDAAALTAYGLGWVNIVPAGAAHFSASMADGAAVQESGDGPTGLSLTEKK
jgi:hypothetical protein